VGADDEDEDEDDDEEGGSLAGLSFEEARAKSYERQKGQSSPPGPRSTVDDFPTAAGTSYLRSALCFSSPRLFLHVHAVGFCTS
jgi:hypothetical protein